MPAITVLVQLACAMALGLGIWALHQAALGGAELTMLVLLAMAGFDAIAPLPSAWARLGAVRAAAERVFELADRTPAVARADAGHVRPLPTHNRVPAWPGTIFSGTTSGSAMASRRTGR